MNNKISILILFSIFLIFISTIKSEPIYSSIGQTDNIVDIYLTQPFFKFNITSLDYLYYDYEFNKQPIINSCIFNKDYFSFNLTNLKGTKHTFRDGYNNDHYFTMCSDYPLYCGAGKQSCLDSHQGIFPTGNALDESFQISNLSLQLTYRMPDFDICSYGGRVRNYYFNCNENEEFAFTVRGNFYISYATCIVDIDVQTKYVCPYKNTKSLPINNYSLIQPNIIRIKLDKSSTSLISFNNGYAIQEFKFKPIIYSCTNQGDTITINGSFLVDHLKSHYSFDFNGGYSLPYSAIVSFNQTTIVLKSASVTDNNFSISLFGNQSDIYQILKPEQQMTMTFVFDEPNQKILIGCTNCIGAILKGLYNSNVDDIIIGADMTMNTGIGNLKISGDPIYLEAPISPFKKSNVYTLPINFANVNISNNQVFQFNGSSTISMNGYFIPKMYDNQPYIVGKLQFLNGTIYNLEYSSPNDNILTTGKFKTPFGYGNGTFSIYINNNLVHSNSFSYQPPNSVNWVTSMIQKLDKIELQLSFPHLFFPISSIKYNNKNGSGLDYKLVEPNIIIFKLSSDSSTLLSFNNDYHVETIFQGYGYRPVVYNYSIIGNTLTMDGIYLTKSFSNYTFYLGDGKTQVLSNDQVVYFDGSRISVTINQALSIYVYSDVNTFTKVPDIDITTDDNNVYFTCSNCFGGYLDGTDSLDNQFSEIGTIVKQFDKKTIKMNNAYTLVKDSKSFVIQPPLPNGISGLYQLTSFKNGIISIDEDFLFDEYNGLQYTSFELHFDNGTIYSLPKQLLTVSGLNYKYQLNTPFGYGSGNLSTIINFVNGTKSIINSRFNYPIKPIINSVSSIRDYDYGDYNFDNNHITITGEGFFQGLVVNVFILSPGESITTIHDCRNVVISDIGSTITCYFFLYPSEYTSGPITIEIGSDDYLGKTGLEPAYFQTYLELDKVNSDIGLHSIISTLIITLIFVITILIQ